MPKPAGNDVKIGDDNRRLHQSEHAPPHHVRSGNANRGREQGGIFNNLFNIISDNLGGGMSQSQAQGSEQQRRI